MIIRNLKYGLDIAVMSIITENNRGISKYYVNSEGCLFNKNKRASLACAARLADTVSAGGSIRFPGVTLVNYKGDNISTHVYLSVIIDVTRKVTKF